jgi:hypothetical protein
MTLPGKVPVVPFACNAACNQRKEKVALCGEEKRAGGKKLYRRIDRENSLAHVC